jgi:hypothetical protein
LISINKNDEKWFDQFASPLPSLYYKRQHCPKNRFILKLPTEFRLFAYFEREKMSFNSLLTVLSSYWWSNNPAAKPIKTQQNRTTRRSMRSPSTGADFKRHSESYQQQPMYNDELQEVVQQNDGDFFSQQQEQTYKKNGR